MRRAAPRRQIRIANAFSTPHVASTTIRAMGGTFIAMNQFRVHQERCDEFERAWRERESYLDGVDGFESFQLLKGPVAEDGTQLYTSHSVWRDEAAFQAWRDSDAFRKAHAQGSLSGVLAGPPTFTGWTVVDLREER